MEKSKHDYEVEIQTLKQELMSSRVEYEKIYLALANREKTDIKQQKALNRAYKLIEILLDRLESEEI